MPESPSEGVLVVEHDGVADSSDLAGIEARPGGRVVDVVVVDAVDVVDASGGLPP